MAEIEYCLQNMINLELREASNHATRLTIQIRTLLKIMNMLGVPLSVIYETKNLIRIDVSCSSFIEKLWKKYYGENSSNCNNIATTANSFPTSEEWATLERFLAKDFARNVDLIRLTSVLKKRLPEKDLNFIFAVDGLDKLIKDNCNSSVSGEGENSNGENNLKNYFENLSIPIRFEKDEDVLEKLEWVHVYTIRKIYKRLGENVTPEKIGKVLKKIFGLNFNTTTIVATETKVLKKTDVDDNEKRFSSSDEDDENDVGGLRVEEDIIEKNIETLYKNIVGNKLLDIASWKKMEIEKVLMKEMNRKRKSTFATTDNSNLKENGEEVRNKPGRPRVKDSNKKRKVVVDNKEEILQV